MVPTAKEAPAAGYVDPLSGLSVLSLFPRTIRASGAAPMPADSKDLDSIHNIMKSLKELRSPEKLMSEANKIVDGGADLLTTFSNFGENVSVASDVAAKAKDRPQERRPGLRAAPKRASFSLRTSISHPPINLEPTLDIDRLQDPDAFFDAYERNEKAKKEIRKQLGIGPIGIENIDLYKPSNNERRRRPGILGKSYSYKHRFSSVPSENDDTLMSSQETVYQDMLSPPNEVVPEKLLDPDPNIDESEEVEMAESMKKTETRVSDMLEELLSCNDEELDGEGALNLLQERLKIRPLDMGKLFCSTELPDVGMTNILSSSGNHQKQRRSSGAFDTVLKNLNKKPCTEQELVKNPANFVSSPTPPRNPFGSVSLLKKKILQPNPLTDPFSPQAIDFCQLPNSSPIIQDKPLGQVDTPKELGRSNELELRVESAHSEPLLFDMDSQKVIINDDSLLEQPRSENASMRRESRSSGANASPFQIRDELVGKVQVPEKLGIFFEMESNAQFRNEDGDVLHEHFEDVNANVTKMDANSRRNEESDNNIGETANTTKESNPSVADEEARGNASARQKSVPEQQEQPAAKQQRGKRVAGEKRKGASTRRQIDPEQQEFHSARRQRGGGEAGEKRIIDSSTNLQIDPEQQEFDASKQHRGKRVAGGKRIRDAHPMRKSLAEAGTSFQNGVRKSTRVRVRPLEYWKGERLLYERVDNSLKLIGLKYISPGKDSERLKVKKYEELLEMASRH